MDIKVPHLAEGISTGTVVTIFVKEGDKVKKGQDVLELETEKAIAAIPSPEAGVIEKVLIKEGDKVNIGQTVISIAGDGSAGSAKTVKQEAPARHAPVETKASTQVLEEEEEAEEPAGPSKNNLSPAASPSIRKLVRQLGIDLNKIRGTEPGGRISLQDIKNYIARLEKGAASPKSEGQAPSRQAASAAPSIDFSKWGPVERKPMTVLRKKISEKMTESWTTIPHVTQFADADITGILALRKKYADQYESKGARLTVTTFIIQALASVLKKHPIFNSSMDEAAGEIVFKNYYHLGIAVDTEQGLIVPVLKDFDKKDMAQLSKELSGLAERTRQRKVSIDDLQGSSFTISNQGGIGGAHFTPIVNKPEVAILGLGQGVKKPVVINDKVEVRMILPLALSYDHRVIDGANAARFITDLTAAIESFDEKKLTIQESGKSKKEK
ncbi:MAG: 2-oxo acid dehydrogenase subunit E2 [Candidatus Omnitrophica bacterium]|nr:2-oxo acid dehydrogenase subunit E2 [Candidatus Omnitrophota bacterium]